MTELREELARAATMLDLGRYDEAGEAYDQVRDRLGRDPAADELAYLEANPWDAPWRHGLG